MPAIENRYPRIRHRDYESERVFRDDIIADAEGKSIVFPENFNWWTAMACARAAGEGVGREIVVVELDEHCAYALTALPVAPRKKLTLPQRAIVAAFVGYFTTHKPGMRVDQPVILPKVVRDENDRDAIESELRGFYSEAKAYQMAHVCEEVFDLRTRVIEDAAGWLVALDDSDTDQLDAARMERVRGVARLMNHFDVTPAEDNEITEAPEARRAFRERRGGTEAAISRKLDDIILRLDRMVTGNRMEQGVVA